MQNNDGYNGEAEAKYSYESLQKLDDTALRAMVSDAEKIMKIREENARKEAEKTIKKIAEEHGLKVSVTPAVTRKRGRPKKA